jgi:hypothetical protein
MKETKFNTAAASECKFMKASCSYILGQYEIILKFVKNMMIKKTNNINVLQWRAAILCSQWFKWYMALGHVPNTETYEFCAFSRHLKCCCIALYVSHSSWGFSVFYWNTTLPKCFTAIKK